MKLGFFFRLFALGCFLFIASPSKVSATPTDIILSEISIAGTEANDEFIELYNQSNIPLDLSGLQLRRRTSSGSESSLKVFTQGSIIPAHGYFLWANSQGIFRTPFADAETSSSALASDNSVGLFTKSGNDGILIDSITWGKGPLFSPTTPSFPNPEKQTSLSRTLSTLSWSQRMITPTNSKGVTWVAPTPDPVPEPVPTPPSPPGANTLRFNEIFPNPSAKGDQGEFIELHNFGNTPLDISGWSIHDATKTGKYTFPTSTIVQAGVYLVISDQEFTFSLNNTDETLSLFDTTDAIIDTMQYEKTKENVSLNFTTSGWRGGIPTPGKPNQLNTLPETREKVPKKGYRGIPITFDARGKDSDGQTIKYTWNFGDNHKSYKEKTSHTYEENGTYLVTLVTTDGSDDVTETFTLKIESLPKPDIRITAIIPNPAGKDTDGEWILIENRGKKAIDLKGFSVATGWKKLVNHPVRESITIAPKSEVKLTREFSLFTLPNQKGKVELRTPDGKTLQEIKYKLEKSVVEDAVYFKEKGKRWEWRKNTPQKTTPFTGDTEEENMLNEPAVNEAIPTREEAPTETALPQEIIPETNTDSFSEDRGDQQVLGAETTLDERSTDTTLPEVPFSQSTNFLFDFFQNFFINLNSRLNDWQNNFD